MTLTPYYADDAVTLYLGDCLNVLAELAEASVDSVVTDPPYGLEFMGNDWDAPWRDPAVHAQARQLRADEMTVESKRPFIAAGVNKFSAGLPFQTWCESWARQALRVLKPGGYLVAFGGTRTWHRLGAAVEDAGFEIRDSIAWLYGTGFPKSLNVGHGRGTALKPAFEPIVVARKPLAGTVAANIAEHGTGALNIDACRIPHADAADLAASLAKNPGRADTVTSDVYGSGRPQQSVNLDGRWPANVVLDDTQARNLDGARFFYVAKASKHERPKVDGTGHPTVKPLDLMRWLVRLVTPAGGLVLDPFLGSGTTAEACLIEGYPFVGIEQDVDYLYLVTTARLAKPIQPNMFGGLA